MTPSPPTRVRHTARTVARARELAAAGWYPTGISRILAREFDLERPPSTNTIRCWLDPGFREYHIRLNSRARERREGRSSDGLPKPSRLTPQLLLALRVEDGLTYGAIAAVARRFCGEEMTEDECRYRLYELGAPKNPNKARPKAAA